MSQETKVGLFLLAALALILPAILFIGNIKIFERSADYFVEFKDVQALPPKAAVKIAGVEIGKVGKIRLKEGKARVELNIRKDITLHEDASAGIGSTGIIGTRFIEVYTGSPSLPVLKPGSDIRGRSGSGLNEMMDKISKLFSEDPEHGDAIGNLKATLSNFRKMSDSLAGALHQREKELTDIVMNLRDTTANAKVFSADLREVFSEHKEDVKVALKKIRESSEKLDSILGKIDGGEGTIGTLVSDEDTAGDVKETITSLKNTVKSAESVLGRFRKIDAYWDYRYRYDTRDAESRSDVGITLVPREGKFYKLMVNNVGKAPSNEKNLEFERKNRITAVLGKDFGPFTGYAGAIRSDGGFGVSFRPLWFLKKEWERKFSLDVEAADFDRDRTVRGTRLDSTWVAAGGRLSLKRWLWIGARVEDILERSVFMANVNVSFRDEDLAYLIGLIGAAN